MNTPEDLIDQATCQVEKLDINPGDVVVLRFSQPLTTDALERFRGMLGKLSKPPSMTILLPDHDDIESLDQDEMRAHGWVREASLEPIYQEGYADGRRRAAMLVALPALIGAVLAIAWRTWGLW